MNKRNVVLSLSSFLLLFPIGISADNYDKMWKSVEDAAAKDLPKTVMKYLTAISAKAEKEGEYGHLLKAETMMVDAKSAVSPDSLLPQLAVLEDKAEGYGQSDPALAAVYNVAIGKIYEKSRRVDGSQEKAELFFKKALANPSLLASKSALVYKPFVKEGSDSRLFGDNLLSLISCETKCYKPMHDYYAKTSNRVATMLSALWMLQEDRKNAGYAYPRRLDKSHYIVSLDSLIHIYGDLKQCGEVAVARYDYMSSCSDVTVENRVAYINMALNRWGDWQSANKLRNELKTLTYPKYNAYIPENKAIPGMPVTVRFKVRNISGIKVSVARLAVDGDTKLSPQKSEDYKILRSKMVPLSQSSQTKNYIGQPDYKEIEDSVVIGGLQTGVYMLQISVPDKTVKPVRRLLYVSDMYVLNQKLPGNKARIVVVRASTGQPVPGATLSVASAEEDKVETFTCDDKGEYLMDTQDNSYNRRMRASAPGDNAAPYASYGNYFYYYEDKADVDEVSLFTDRRIYRPGQTVRVSALAYNIQDGIRSKVSEGKQIKLSLTDANGKGVKEQTVTTDACGTAAADFVLPSGGLTGRFLIRASGKGFNDVAWIRVEEYKRPTFKVEFPDVNTKYVNGDTIVVTAHARTYAGVAVQGAKVKYTVKRNRALWWYRFDDSGSSSEVLFSGEGVTDADGAFKVEMPMLLPGTNGKDGGNVVYDSWRIARFYNIVAEADVTDQSGETRSAELSLPLGSKPTAFACDLPKKFVRDSLKTITFTLKNSAGKDIDGTVRYYVDGSFNAFTARTNKSVKVEWNSPATLKSGKHTLAAVCDNDTIRRDFVVFSMDDTKPCVETHDWFYASDNQFPADGRPVYVQVGSSDTGTHIVYTVISGNKVLESSALDVDNGIVTRKFTYNESYGTGLLLTYTWVKDGKLYSHSVQIKRPLPDKRLIAKWTTFRDKLTPGQKETWTLNVSKPDGTPADAQLMATLYDASLDQITPFGWSFSVLPDVNMPYTSWGTAHYGRITMANMASFKMLDVKKLALNRIVLGTIMPTEESKVFNTLYATNEVRTIGSFPVMAKHSQAAVVSADAELSEAVYVRGSVDRSRSAADAGAEAASGSAPAVQLRENLNETAFFYPTLQTDKDGNVAVSFTLPESLTTWKFLGLAHDKDVNYGLVNAEAVASKTVMVQPNMPRFARVGDRSSISSRIINTSGKAVKGNVVMQLTDPETDKVVSEQKKTFKLDADSTSTVTFDYYPDGSNSLLVCKIFASGKGFSDGEQHYLPVLTDKELVVNTMPFTLHKPEKKTLDVSALLPSGGTDGKLAVEYTNNPAWLMVQALPYIGTARDDDAISLAVSYYANGIGAYITRQSPKLKSVFEQWKREESGESLMSNLEKNQELKSIVLDETPWVAEAENEADRKRLVSNYFDENTLDNKMSTVLSKLKNLQNPADGSFSWWVGSKLGSSFVTCRVLELLARLNAVTGRNTASSDMIDKGLKYIHEGVAKDVAAAKKAAKDGKAYSIDIEKALHYLYVCSLQGHEMSSAERSDADFLIAEIKKNNRKMTLYNKAMAAVVLAFRGEKELAGEYIKSLDEYTVGTEETGRYYDTPRAVRSCFDYRIPTQTAVIEAMTLVDPEGYSDNIEEMKKWLLMQKRVQDWDTPVNSANAVYAFLNGNAKLLESVENATISLDGKALDTSQATAGLGYVKVSEDVSSARELTVNKTSEGTSWGAVYGSSLQKMSDISSSAAGFKVVREVVSSDGKPVSSLQVGDKVKVRITVTADQDYDFVCVSDKRAACMEPVRQLSGYRNGYYCATKDNATDYFFDRMPKGSHVIETEFYVDRAGLYNTGTCTVQCVYAPEYSGRTGSAVIEVR